MNFKIGSLWSYYKILSLLGSTQLSGMVGSVTVYGVGVWLEVETEGPARDQVVTVVGGEVGKVEELKVRRSQ